MNMSDDILDPPNFIKNFPTIKHFKAWADKCDILDLHEAITCFEYYEMYEHCAIMQNAIDVKVNKMLGFEEIK